MNRIDNFHASVNHVQPDNLMLDLGGCPLSSMEGKSQYKLLDLLGFPLPKPQKFLFGKVQRLENSILEYLDIDTRSVGEILRPEHSQFDMINENLYIDEWGIKRKFTGLYWDIVENPLRNATKDDLDKYEFPNGDTLNMSQIEEIGLEARRLFKEGNYVICAEHPVYGVFELGCWLCGFEEFLARLIEDTGFVHKLFEKILDYQKKVIEVYYSALGPYIHYTSSGDDFAMQKNLFMSPANFRELVMPYFKERIVYTKRFTNALYLHHSCGNVASLIPELLESGVDILNPIQPVTKEMQPQELKNKYGKDIIFHGGIDIQNLLLNGSKEGIEEGVKEVIDSMNQDGGYIFAAAHNIQEDIPPEHVLYMFEAARRFGKKKEGG